MGNSIIINEFATLNFDFIISMLFLLVIVVSVLSIAEGRLITAQETTESVKARLLSEKVAQAIEVSYSGGEGHQIMIEMPSDLKGSDYKVKVNQSGVTVLLGGRCGYSFSYTKKISNYDMDRYEVFMFPRKNYIIRNVKDTHNYPTVIIFEDY